MPKRKIKWGSGDVFAVPLLNGNFAVGQVLDLMMVNQVRLALYDEPFPTLEAIALEAVCHPEHLVSLVASTREQLDYRVWKVIGNQPVSVPMERHANEQFRHQGWVGATHYDAALVEDFLDAYYALRPWDTWFNPNYLDAFLVEGRKRPKGVILTKSAEGNS
jgi:hypothetical protein